VVHVDVSVLDRDRRPVRGLSAADFTVLEDGKLRPIVAFTPVDIPDPLPLPSGTAPWVRELAPDVIGNDLAPAGRLVIIMFDQSIRVAEQPVARRIAASAVDALGPNDLAAVVHTGAGRAQNLTRDRALLLSAIESPLMGFADGEEWINSDPTNRAANPVPGGLESRRGRCPSGHCTLEGITRIADAVRDLPRRKRLLLIGTAIQIQRFGDPQLKELRDKMFRALDAANLTVYPMDPVGLQTLAPDAAVVSDGRPDSRGRVNVAEMNLLRQGNLRVLSDRTGGRTIVNANDPDLIVPEIFRESRSYYALGFESASKDSRFHEIAVRVNRPNVSVQSRKGHYAGASRAPVIDSKEAPPDLVAAISSQWPRSDATLRVTAAAFADPNGTKPIAVLVVRLPTVTGKLASLAAAFDTTGRAINSHWQTLDASSVVPPGAAPDFEVLSRLPLDPGRYEIRAAVRDGDRKIGSVYTYVEVPNFAKASVSLSNVVLDMVPPISAGPPARHRRTAPVSADDPARARRRERGPRIRARVSGGQGGDRARTAVREDRERVRRLRLRAQPGSRGRRVQRSSCRGLPARPAARHVCRRALCADDRSSAREGHRAPRRPIRSAIAIRSITAVAKSQKVEPANPGTPEPGNPGTYCEVPMVP
jgi:VWFA-related protein